jgi:type III pantothenate kinase
MVRIPSVLACDVGNTSIRLALVDGEETSPPQSLRVGDLAELGSTLKALWETAEPPCKLAASSVNPPALKALEAAAMDALHEPVLVVGRDLPLPIATDLEAPEHIGVDRLCCAAAAYDRLGTSCVIADFGTAITIDCVGEEGLFLGGAILPGLSMSADALHSSTALLPRVELASCDWVYGKDTRQAILGGLLRGARGALRELTEAYATELKHWPTVICTGGDAERVCGHPGDSGLVQAIVPELALRGVAMAYFKSLLK